MTKRFVLIEVYEEDIGIPEEYSDLKAAQHAMLHRMEDVGVDLDDTDSYFLAKDKTEARWYPEDFSWKVFERNGDIYDMI